MAKITLDTITSGFQSTSQVNNNNSDIVTNLNDKVLYRDNPTGEPNQMNNLLDMNSNQIINLPAPSSPTSPLRFLDIPGVITVEFESTVAFDTVDLMVASLVLSVGDIVRTSGYLAIGDGGDNSYEIVAAATGTVDGGSFIGLVSGLQAKALFPGGEHKLKHWGVFANSDGLGGGTDDTVAIQAAIDFAKDDHLPIEWVDTECLVTTTLKAYDGTRIFYPIEGGLLTSFGMTAKAGIFFNPASLSDLFLFQFNPSHADFGFITNISVTGLMLKGGTNARYSMNLDHVIDSYFSFGAEGFVAATFHDGTINNRFESCTFSDMSSVCCFWRNISTTDVFDSCRFQQSPQGIDSIGSVGIRLVNCLFEQIANIGISIDSTCRGIQFDTCYAEDVPFNPTIASTETAMFAVGLGAGPAQNATSLIVTGGIYNGQNSVAIGSLFNVGFLNGAIFSNLEANRFTQLFKTTANTNDRSIFCSGIGGVSWTFATDTAKLQGVTPGAAQFAGSGLPHNAFLNVVNCSTFRPRVGFTTINMDVDELIIRKLDTDTRTANTNTPSGPTVSSMPIHSSSGTLIGFIPIYASQW